MIYWPKIRDISLFVFGLVGVAHETIIQHAERPTLLILFAAMLGLPAFLKAPDSTDKSKPEPKE